MSECQISLFDGAPTAALAPSFETSPAETVTTSPASITIPPFYEDRLVAIYHGESQDLLPLLPLNPLTDEAVHVVTDPPYGIGLDYGDTVDDWRPDWHYWEMIHRLTPRHTSLHMTVSNRHLPYWISEVEGGGWEYIHTSVYWNEGRAGGNWNGQFAYAWEPMLHFKKPGYPFKLGKRMLTDVFKHDGSRTTDHPAERDISAWKTFMDHLPEGMILDPFLGSGTTLRAALDLGRPAIGIERELTWCRDAAARCAQMSLLVP